jgi:hypothetical protein
VSSARSLGVSEATIGLTIVAIGTTAPEFVTTVVSTLRGNRDLALRTADLPRRGRVLRCRLRGIPGVAAADSDLTRRVAAHGTMAR